MNRRYSFHSVLFAVIMASSSLLIQPAVFAADPPDQDRDNQRTADNTKKKCKKYVREHHGHPGKGIDVVKVVYVDCVDKR